MEKEIKKQMHENKNNEEMQKLNKVNEEIKKLNEMVQKLQNELTTEKEKNMRVSAEMINFKRRKEDEVSSMLKYANEDMIITLLPIVDNFERAIKLDDDDLSDEVSKFLAGFKLIYGNLVSLLNDANVKEIVCDGMEFDPKFEQAILTEKDENKPSGVVLEVLQKGYMYKDKVIRPAMVKVNE